MKSKTFVTVLFAMICISCAFAGENKTVKIEGNFQTDEYRIESDGRVTSLSLASHLVKDEKEGINEGIYGKAAINGKSGKIAITGIRSERGGQRILLLIASPDGRNVEKIAFGKDTDIGINPEWITDNLILLRSNQIGYDANNIVNVSDHSIRTIEGGTYLAVDSKSDNYACIYGDLNWFIPEHGLYSGGAGFSRPRSDESVFLRYKGYWVYPKPLEAWLNKEEYEKEKWEEKIGRMGVVLGSMGAKIGVTVYDLSVPAFVSNTTWVAFVERIYKGGNTVAAEHNLVLLDAHKVNTNPPDQRDILIKKKRIPAIPAEEISRDVMIKWNEDSGSVEVWEGNRRYLTYEKLLGRAPIDTAGMVIGEYQKQ